ncbi:2-hydroxyacid dehydrogenase [Desmospora activa]|uniref:Glyoxylate reductase n=1 Tax=Desmospora activa DSM 45169 TaxID=1121389 RepID=A0A2T4Z9I6_9BACL|nr:D-glycerate dehydrogenase [Desmospora activa]PTM58549.1 glyoxylate reductase [Desmospora activa DSM 45169]
MKNSIYITRKIPEEVVKRIAQTCEVRMWEEEETPVPREVLQREIAEVDGLYCMLTESIDAELLNHAKKLRVISNMAVGYNNIDVDTATQRGMVVANTPGVLTETTADLTFALLLATARRLVEGERFVRQGQWHTWAPMLLTGQEVHGSTLGIIGLGRIGQAVAKRAKGFDMDVLYYNRSRKREVENELGIQYVDLDALLQQSDFVCVLTPYTPETKNLIDRRELSLMKKSAVLINTARGGIVNEEALVAALKDGTIWAAGLDVFVEEPVSPQHPLLSLPNVVALPHIGSASIKTRIAMAQLAADNLLKALTGEKPDHLVNPEVWGKS